MPDYQDYYNQYSTANSKNDESGGGGTGGGEISNDVGNPIPVNGTINVGNFPATQTVAGTVTADTELPAASAIVDGGANPTTSRIGANNLGWNGTTWDRLRSGVFGPQSSATGILNNLGLAQYNVTPPVLTDGQWVGFQLDANGRLNVATRYTQQLGAAFSSTFSAIAGFRAADPTTPPTYTAGFQAATIDLNGAVLANVRSLLASRDSVAIVPVAEASAVVVSVTSTTTAYVDSAGIDLTGYSTVTVFPNVTTAGGSVGYFKISWSEDNTNWFDETSDTLGAAGTPATGEKLVTQDVVVRQFASAAVGFKSTSACTLSKRAKFFRISQKSGAAATTIATAYNYQRF